MWICCDIGHARLTGARGNGLEEHAMCERIAPLLRDLAEKAGHRMDVVDFPHLDNDADIARTIAYANERNYGLGISLHCDSSKSPAAHGAHVCCVSATGRRIARAIAAPLCALVPGRAEPVQHRDNLAMLNRTRAPWCLIECGFLTHAGDAALISEHPEKIAAAIWSGLQNYIDSTSAA